MEIVLLDSSFWLSFYLQDSNYIEAKDIIETLYSDKKIIIYMPTIIYVEIINTILKSHIQKIKIKKIKKVLLHSPNIKIIHAPKRFWVNRVEKYAKLVTLKSSDLIILANTFEYKVSKFYSFDKKLIKEYKTLKKYL